MRVSSLQIFQSGLRNMQVGQTDLAQLQQQISTGKNLIRPSDDPVAAAQILKFRRELATNETYQENITVSQRRLELEEIVLGQFKDAGDRLMELALQGNNGTLNDQNRKSIAKEVEEVQRFILGLMNTKDAQGEYLFSGAKGKTQPFVSDGQGGFQYNGDDETRLIQTGPEAYIQSTDSGRDIFQVIPGDIQVNRLNDTVPAALNLGVSVTPAAGLGSDTEFESWVDENGKLDLTLVFNDVLPAPTYDLLDGAGVSVLGAPQNIPAAVLAGTETVIDLSPPGLTVDITVDPGDFDGAGAGSGSVTLRPEIPRHTLLTTAQELIDALNQPVTNAASREQLSASIADVLEDTGIAREGVLETHTELGGRLVTLDNQEAVNEDFQIFTKIALSNLEDLDYAAAIAKFSFQEVALQAAQQTFSRVNNLSLFNYL